MATVFKALLNDDVAHTRTLLHEGVPMTGSLISGSYLGTNIKSFSHAYFQAVYDYNYQSSSANHLFDISAGYSSASNYYTSSFSGSTVKRAVYDQMAQVLMGYDSDNAILRFDQDGNITEGGTKIDNAVFLCMSRLLNKDEMKKGTVQVTMGLSASYGNPFSGPSGSIIFTDNGAATSYFTNSPAGEYAPLISGSTTMGLVFYQAGVIVLDATTVFSSSCAWNQREQISMSNDTALHNYTIERSFRSSSNTELANDVRHRIKNIQFNNTTELNSTIYFCRAHHNEFNYSSNPTYLSGSKIRVKSVQSDAPVSYITGVGLYSANGELLAVAKLSEPLKKSPDNEIVIRTRLDF